MCFYSRLRRKATLLPSVLLLAAFGGGHNAHASRPLPYAQSLDLALSLMEQGKHERAAAPLLDALTAERNDPTGLLALGTLYLHGGSPAKAARAFHRAALLDLQNPLGKWGEFLCKVITNPQAADTAALASFSDSGSASGTLAGANDMSAYLRLMRGQSGDLPPVSADEPDLLKLEIAAFDALRSGNKERGEALLRAFLSRPGQNTLTEERALIAPFLGDALLQSGVPLLSSALPLPNPPANAVPLSGHMTLMPMGDVPNGTAAVSYAVDGGGGGYSASVNYAPFAADLNTTRFPNGVYTIHAIAQSENGRVLRQWEKAVVFQNADAAPSRALSPDERRAFSARLLRLLTPRPSRKAAHFALAELAAHRGENETALAEMEKTAAIDPTYRGAIDSLKVFNRETQGKRAGVWRGVTEEKIVALTFDDGPNPAKTPALMDALKNAGVPATFFVVGIRAEAAPDLLRRMTGEGHEIANHSYSHPNLTFLTPTGVERELCRTSAIVYDATGTRPRFYRPPGGNYNTSVVDAAESLGMAGAYWTIDGIKYEAAPFKPQTLNDFVLKQLRPGAIILLHNAPDNTIAALPALIAGIKARGYQLVTVSELVRRSRTGTLAPLAAQTGKVKNGPKE